MTKPKRTQTQTHPGPTDQMGNDDVHGRLEKARREHAAGLLNTEGYVWTVMQCYAAAESQHGSK